MVSCPSSNTVAVDQSSFWSPQNVNWDTHRIGWAIAGACAVLTVVLSTISVTQHCRNYTRPYEQRQILRILYMPPIYAVISFFSYRFFRSYTYYSLVQVAYEAVTISAFLLLLIEYVADSATGHDVRNAIARKDKRPLPIPFCCLRYRPTKPYFMYAVKWCVLQYVIVRPAASLAGIVCEGFNVLCEAAGFNVHFANVYLAAIDFISISVALYGLLLFYGLTKDELADRRPLAKFLSIKLIVMFTFYQSFVFSALEGKVIHATQYWTASNVADGLNALTICIEMVLFSGLMWWAYPATEYRRTTGAPATSAWRPLWDSINYSDFALEIYGALRFFLGRRPAQGYRIDAKTGAARMDFGQAFGVGDVPYKSQHGGSAGAHARPSFNEDIRLARYDAE